MAWTGRRWPGSKLAKPGEEKQKSLAYNWPALATAGRAKNWSSLQETLTSLAKIKLQGMHTCSGFTLSGQSYRIISPPKLTEATKTCTIINMTIIAMLSRKSV